MRPRSLPAAAARPRCSKRCAASSASTISTSRRTRRAAPPVSAGKYLNDRTYVTIEKGEKAGSGKATIDLDVGRGVKLRGEANDSGDAKGGIFYEREY